METKNLTHHLTQTNTGKILNLTLNDKKIISKSGKEGKLRTIEKEFSNAEEAFKNFYKKEWQALKKGFVFFNENAKIGSPVLHKFIGGGFSGSLSFEQTPNGIYIYKSAKQTDDDLIDKLVMIDTSGALIDEVNLPKPLAWNIKYRAETNSLLLDIDHFIYEFDLDNNAFTNLGNDKSNITSFISTSKNKTAFASLDEFFIVDNSNTILFSQHYNIEAVSGKTTPFCGKLSNDGELLAFHNKVGEIQIIDTATGKLLNKIEADFEMINQFEFAHNNDLLVVKEDYGTWGMRYFDLTTNKEIKIEELEIPEYIKEVDAFCFNPTQSKLVLRQYNRTHVFDFIKRELLHSFEIKHMVKTCKMKFIGDRLGVRTDYGCFSIYNV